ncbi:MAG TPA: his operon leader peptide [Scandinavium sp.]|nr:his operon leader peptide [Scandinavium sp.]HEX4500155.1 his operon leader peptide [Scandinavium sp.]
MNCVQFTSHHHHHHPD